MNKSVDFNCVVDRRAARNFNSRNSKTGGVIQNELTELYTLPILYWTIIRYTQIAVNDL